MIHSDLAGRNHVREDVFTSNCLGLLVLLGGLDVLNFFKAAKSLRQEALSVTDCQEAELALDFWPYLRDGGIPDAIVTIKSSTTLPFKIVVEAKHGAGKSGNGDNDQLARYWRAAESLYPGRCAVVYLTHERAFPKQDIEQSLEWAGNDARIFWLSWCDLFRYVDTQLSPTSSRSPLERRILEVLREYLAAFGYSVFLGWNKSVPDFVVTPYRRHYAASADWCPSATFRRRYSSTIAPLRLRQYLRTYGHELTLPRNGGHL
jgi:hypothetical protein